MIVTLAVRSKDVSGSAVSGNDLIRALEQSGEYLYMADTKDSDMLEYLAAACVRQFVDTETATCRFDDPAFAELLAWCAALPDRTSGQDFSPENCMVSIEQVNLVRLAAVETYYFHEPFTYVGFPTGDGCGHYYACSGNACCRAAIPANSRNKAGAWAFISAQLTVDRQMHAADPYYVLPVTREAFDRAAQGPIGYFGDRLTEAQLGQLYTLLDSTNKARTSADEQLISIINESAAAYFHGDKSLEDTVRLIQSRASIYVSERYG